MNLEFEAPTITAPAAAVLPDIGISQPFSLNSGPSLGEGFNFNPSFGMEIKPITIGPATKPNLHFPSVENLKPEIHLDRTVPVPEIVFNEKLFEVIRPNVPQILDTHFEPFTVETQSFISALEKEADIKARDEAINLANILFPNTAEGQNFWVAKIQQALDQPMPTVDGVVVKNQAAPEIIFPLTPLPLQDQETQSDPKPVTMPKTETLVSEDLSAKPETQTQTQASPQATTKTIIDPGIGGPDVPEDDDGWGGEPNNGGEWPLDGEEPEWDEFITSEKHQIARASLKKRRHVAKGIFEESTSSFGSDLVTRVESKIYKLDVPDLVEADEIASRRLEYPQIARDIEANLSYVENRDNPTEVYTAIEKAVSEKPPIERTRKLASATRKRESELAKEPRTLALQGARFIALLKEMVWVPTKKLRLEEPVEMQKVQKSSQRKKAD